MPSDSRQVIDDLLRGRRATRVGLMGSPWTDSLVAWQRDGYPMRKAFKRVGELRWREDGKRVKAETAGEYEEPVPPWQHFGYDMAGAGPWFDQLPLRDVDELVDESDEWEVRRNGAGAALKYWKHKMGTPEHIDFRMTEREIWERDYRPHLLQLEPERVQVRELRDNYAEVHNAGLWTHLGHMFIWEIMRQSMGDVTMYQSLLLDPAWVHDFARVYTDFFKVHFQYMFDQLGLPDGIWLYEDLGYK
ncbi:MAG: hypothetical protein JXA74_17435, partial [Anaerolineae bacterium]|nr:hypothetical protein [Anaerolineae bacterium]